jgi:hypothetical protein
MWATHVIFKKAKSKPFTFQAVLKLGRTLAMGPPRTWYKARKAASEPNYLHGKKRDEKTFEVCTNTIQVSK